MRSLFMKVFLWFWVAMLLVSATLIISVAETQTTFVQGREDERDREQAPHFAAVIADVYERQGAPALSTYLRYPPPPYASLYFFTEDGGEISGGVVTSIVTKSRSAPGIRAKHKSRPPGKVDYWARVPPGPVENITSWSFRIPLIPSSMFCEPHPQRSFFASRLSCWSRGLFASGWRAK